MGLELDKMKPSDKGQAQLLISFSVLKSPMSAKEVWTWVHYNYGDDLGLTSEDDDYVAPHGFDDLTEKLREEIPAIKEPGTDSEVTSLTTDPPGVNTAASNEDTDVLSDEAFGPRHPPQQQQQQQQQNSSGKMVAATTATLTEDGGGGGEGAGDGGGGGGGTTSGGAGMVNGDVKVPAEFMDSSDDSDAEFFCEGQDHLEKMYLDEVFNLNIDSVFECLFTDSAFFRAFVGSRKTFDLSLPDWEEELDENGNKNRNITYTLTLNNSIGPKISPSTEKQICYAMSRPGRIYHVDCECCNGGIPYAESFYVLLRYCLTRVSKTKCRVVVTGELKYRKHVIGMFRGMIEKSAVNGLTDYCRQLSVHLRREAERQEVIIGGHQPSVAAPGGGVGGPALKKKVRRKRGKLLNQSDSGAIGGTSSKTHSLERTTSTPPSPSKNSFREDKLVELNAHTLVRIIIVILVLLLLFNAVLFYKLWSLESYASSLYGIPTQESLENFAKHPRSQEEWSQLLQQQRQVYEKEINKWEEVLSVSITIVDQMKTSLLQLKKSLHMGTYRHDES
ncbi:GRAM domain-containing protein 1B-like [Elysia marginata]|uniref:GRAM domain-containing protein 1B-like n=1 Tax=Elysia marginata TaxID=1093978 RepID=A0AAV4JVT3_9GAST|nr:GRAM domain-containing protein 1B-like [Elysia marginata]